jgi:oligopeptide transport system ATP-binding protein
MSQPEARSTVLEIRSLVKHYPHHSPILHRKTGYLEALKGVDLHVEAGRTTALVGESGSGKSTLARCVVGLEKATSGTIRLGPVHVTDASINHKVIARHAQIVFQDPNSSLSPHMTARAIVEEPLLVHRQADNARERARIAGEALEAVGIAPRYFGQRPRDLSGGQRQRVAIARALVLDPELLLLDEPVSALDVSVQAQILLLLQERQRATGAAFLLISHDLAVVRAIAHHVYVMSSGEIVESGSPSVILSSPQHPYTQQLLHSEPSHPAWDPDLVMGKGTVAS